MNVGISPPSIEHGHVFCLNKSALDSDSAQTPIHFSTLSHISGIVTSFVPQVSVSWPRSAPFSTCKGSKSMPGAWKQMNEALMLSSRWASVSAAAARLKQCVGKVGQSLSFLQGTRKKNFYLLHPAVMIEMWKALPICPISFPVNVSSCKQGTCEKTL